MLYDPAVSLLGMYVKEMQSVYERDSLTPTQQLCSQELKIGNQPSCASVDEWIKMMWYRYMA